ncbi:MAG: hypothetical protein ACPHQD_04790 [Vibrio toranzoniae]|uniref:hypothetical protein n=1 Tax=Vibrio toranzoniae TaxID=1194427 RepID=UPI003C66C046
MINTEFEDELDNFEPRTNDFEQAASQGDLVERYDIYVALSEDMEEEVKPFDEWLNS